MPKSSMLSQEFSGYKDKKNSSNFLRPFIPPRGLSTKLNEVITENLDERSTNIENASTRNGDRQKNHANSLPSSLQMGNPLFDTYSTRHNSNISSAKDSKESSEDEIACDGFVEEGIINQI